TYQRLQTIQVYAGNLGPNALLRRWCRGERKSDPESRWRRLWYGSVVENQGRLHKNSARLRIRRLDISVWLQPWRVYGAQFGRYDYGLRASHQEFLGRYGGH